MLKTGVWLCLGLSQGRNTVNKRQNPTKETLSHSRKTDSLLWQKQKIISIPSRIRFHSRLGSRSSTARVLNPYKDLRRSDLVKLTFKTLASGGVKTFALLKRRHAFCQQRSNVERDDVFIFASLVKILHQTGGSFYSRCGGLSCRNDFLSRGPQTSH